MKILQWLALATLCAAALPIHSQTVPGGNTGPDAIKSKGLVEAMAAIAHGILPQGRHFSQTNSIASGNWVREWNGTYTWSKGTWVNMVQNTFTYDIYGNQLSQLGESWENSTWKNSHLQTWTYDEQGHEITHTSQTWNGSAWSGTAVDTELYNAEGQRTSVLSRYLSGSAWVNQYLYTYAYDSAGNETMDLCQEWDGSAWVNSRRWTYGYDANGFYVNFLWEVWSDGAWENYGRSIVTNDAGGRETYALQQAWYDGGWVNYSQNTLTYGANGLKATDLYDTRTLTSWVHSTLNSFTYDTHGNRTDELEQAWKDYAWENSARYVDHWKKIPDIQITKPAASELVPAGEPYIVRWKSTGVDSLIIDFSVDGGTTYKEAARSVPAGIGRYTWMVPDSLSTRCKLRLTDRSEPSSSVSSELFRVKGYRLTRLDANGDYEAFDPARHALRFTNDSTEMWPAAWYGQFNYRGTDPYTNKPYPPTFVNAPNRAKTMNFVDWPLFARTFNPARCYMNISKPVYSPTAVKLWYYHRDTAWAGSCVGFSQACLLAFDRREEFLQAYPAVNYFLDIHDLENDDSLRMTINQLYESQFGYAQTLYRRTKFHATDVRTCLKELKEYFLSDSTDHRAFSMFTDSGAHSVVPFRLDHYPDLEGDYIVRMYDNNYPSGRSDNGYRTDLVLDSAQNIWSYAPYNWQRNDGMGIYLDIQASTYLTSPILWKISPSRQHSPAPSLRKAAGDTMCMSIYSSISANIAITNATGQSIGFHDGVSYNTLGDGIPILPENGVSRPPMGYFIPEDTYSIRMSGFRDSFAHLSVLDETGMFDYWRSDALNNQTDRLSYDGAFALGNPDAQTKAANLEVITRLSGCERDFQILNCAIVHNDSVTIAAPDSNRVAFVNLGPPKTYDLNVVLAGESSSGAFVHTSVTVPAHSTHIIVPDWQDIENQPVKVYEDIGNTGEIHDTLSLANQVTGVKEQLAAAIPQEFRLEQNYPNPFNPTTTIAYSVGGVRAQGSGLSDVRLVVYDVLGREVAVLVNERKAPGTYTMAFDGSRLASGVYIYRLTAGSFVQSRKMILLR